MYNQSENPAPHYRALVVEDDEISRICLVSLLLQFGLDVEEADTGRKAVDLLQTLLFDLVFLDLQLPDGDGEEVLTRIWDIAEPPGPVPPIIAVTTQMTPERADHVAKAGFDDILIKPVAYETLTQKIVNWLKAPDPAIELSRQISRHLQRHLPLGLTLIRKLLADLPQQLAVLEAALGSGQKEKAASIVHQLNGAAGFLGLAELQKYAVTMEAALHKGNEPILTGAWHDLKKEAQRLLTLGPELLDCLAQEASLNFSSRV